MTCDVKKVTYNMYSCDTCCMNREMMEMDGLNIVKCQKSRRRDALGIKWKFNYNKTKTCIVSSSPKAKKHAAKE